MNRSNKIESKNIRDILALTPMQEGMLFHYLQAPRDGSYFNQLNLELSGDINLQYFEKAWNFVLKTNEMLRTVFRWEKLEKPTQVVLKRHTLHLKFEDLSSVGDSVEQKKQWDIIKQQDSSSQFDLRQVPFRVILGKMSQYRYQMLISNHHILYDGWSTGIILKEFFQAYETLAMGSQPLVPLVKSGFKEFIQWHQEQNRQEQKKFWQNYLEGFNTPTRLPIKRSQPAPGSPRERNYRLNLGQANKDKLEVFVKDKRITLAAVFYSAWGVLLQKYCGLEDVVFGITVSGRSAPVRGIGDMVGLFINTVPFRAGFEPGEGLMDFLVRINNQLAASEKYENTPLVDIYSCCQQLTRLREELFDTLVSMENYPLDTYLKEPDSHLSIQSYSMEEMPHYDLTVVISAAGGIDINFIYNNTCFDKEIIERFAHHFGTILEGIGENFENSLHEIEILSGEEKQQLLVDFNRTAAAYPVKKAIHELFAKQVERSPHQVALVGPKVQNTNYQQKHLSYRELNERSDKLAGLLIEKGVLPGDMIAIMVKRSPEMVIGILGILKAGGAYLPITDDYPQERIQYMLTDSRSKILLTNQEEIGKWNCMNEKIVNCQLYSPLERGASSVGINGGGGVCQNLHLPPAPAATVSSLTSNCQVKPENLAYVLYTSGSTGKPKGVLVEHGPVVNLLLVLHHRYPLREQDTYLLKTSYLFDVSVTELFGWFLEGGRLAVLEPGGEKDPKAIIEMIAREGVTHINFVPSMFHTFVEMLGSGEITQLAGLKYIFLAGEALLPDPVNRFRRLNTTTAIENIYGPTEAAVYASWYSLADWKGEASIPIGRPLPNVILYIFDKWGYLQPIGVPGELCIGGEGLALGYLNNPELTFEKFGRTVISHLSLVINPSNKRSKAADYRFNRLFPNDQCLITNDRLYHTGDLARWLPDGNVEYLGRMDFQVKVRGFRIELGEIENWLVKHPGVKEAVVVAHKDAGGEVRLCAYVVGGAAQDELHGYLSGVLPAYMVPAYFEKIGTIPLTSSGKVNRSALPAPAIKSREKYTAPRDEIEESLVNTWAEVLKVDKKKIGIDANFFELGGHSLNATALVSKIHKKLKFQFQLTQVFEMSTVRAQAAYMAKRDESPHVYIDPIEKREYYDLSSAQKRLYFLQQMDPGSTSYNMTLVLPLENVAKDINKEKLEFNLKRLISRHESLRTSFLPMGEKPVQRIHDLLEFEIQFSGLGPGGNSVKCVESRVNDFIRPFDLSQAPLIRSSLLELSDGNHLWIVDMHHIISDGTSSVILADDFISSYNGDHLNPLSLQYKDFSHWQNRWFKSGKIKAQEEYWLDLYSDARDIPRLRLPADFKRPEVFTFKGDRFIFRLEREDAVKFRALGFRHNSTLYMNILAALDTLFYIYTGQSDIIIGSGIAGRRHEDLHGIIGMFVNTLAMRNYPDGEKTYESFLNEVMANSIKAFDNQDVQFEELVDKLDLERDTSRNPLFDISMVVQNFSKAEERSERREKTGKIEIFSLGNENLFELEYRNPTTKFDMTFFIDESGEDVSIMIEYYTGIFREVTVKQMARHFKNLIKAVVKAPSLRLKDIELISAEEKRLVLYDFNDVSRDYPLEMVIHKRFEEKVEKTPDNVALVYEDYFLTYKKLNERANQVARYLYYEKGIQSEEGVGILLDKGIEIIVALIGTLKAGGAYIAMESSFPQERKKHIIIDSHIGVVLSEKNHIRDLNRLQWECDCFHSYLCLDSEDVYKEEEVEKNELMNRELWEHVGETAADEIAGGGWMSSYTGELMSKQEMDEYGDNILKKLRPLLHEHMRVLEIGTASGITMYRISPKVGLYYGTDLSSVIINKNRERAKEEDHQNIKLACLAAHEIDQVEEKDFHLIIINSVIQSFHGHNYLRQVIGKCIDLMGERGYLFIGDIMDQDLKYALAAEMNAFKHAHQDKSYTTKTDFSAELFVSRGFWEDLEAQLEVIEAVDFSGKIYTIENELTKFRYDTLMTINKGLRTGEKRIKQRNKYQEDLRCLAVVDTGDSHPVSAQVPPYHLAYVIYTSGTTGHPKGVMVEHSQVNNCLYWMQETFKLNSTDVVLHRTNLTFDPSVWEIFWPLVIGAGVKVIRSDQRKDAEYFIQLMEQNEGRAITLMYCPSSLVTGMTYLLSSSAKKQKLKLPWLIIGAEPIRMEVVKEFYTYFSGIIVNTYGPTEGTINNTYYNLEANDLRPVVPIGKPVSNNHIYIFSHDMNPVSIFIAGEIYIGGDSVGRGYLNQPELTYEKFKIINYKLIIKNGSGALRADLNSFGEREAHELQELPQTGATSYEKFLRGESGCFTKAVFSKSVPPGRRRYKIYKTGDMARWLVDGNIEFLGRVDQQVKIRGYRIELGEIEKWLLQHDKIKEGVVVLHDGTSRKGMGSEKFLCAYIVLGDFVAGIDSGELRRYLSDFLPDYMVPSHFIQIPRIPLTPGGKVYRKALPVPKEEVTGDEQYAPPRDNLEKRLAAIWSEVLNRWGQGLIGLDDNFFALGGHSLKATILTAKIHKELKAKLPLAEVFKRQTIRGMAEYIRETGKDEYARIETVEKKEYYALSSAQKRLYVLWQMEKNDTGYNESAVLELEGKLNRERFERTFSKLINRHESFRTSFTLIEHEPVQRIHDHVEFKIENYQVDEEVHTTDRRPQTAENSPGTSLSSVIRHPSSEFIRPFDLTRAPLLRVGLIKKGNEKHILMLDLHHIITDGISQGIFIKDFMALYQGENLPGLRVQYKDFSQWQNREKHMTALKRQEHYWVKEFNHEIPLLNLPADFVRPPVQSFAGSNVDFKLDLQKCAALKKMAQKEGATLFMVLLAIYNIFIAKISGQEDIIIGTPISGRRHTDLHPIIGMFVNTLALRNTPHGHQSFKELLTQLREKTLQAFENQDYPFENLVEQVAVNRDVSRNPIFDTMFALQNMETAEIKIPGLVLKQYDYEKSISKFDLTLNVRETGKHLELTFEYSTKLFKKETILQFTGFFKKTVSTVIENYETRISGIEIITVAEKRRILHDFNDTGAKYPCDQTIHQLFAEQVERTPDHTALLGPEYDACQRNYRSQWFYISITYKELNQKSDQLAYMLKEKGIGVDNIVGIMVERSLEMIIGLLGILKAGVAYLPIDPEHPGERIDYMLKDSGADILLTGPEIAGFSSAQAFNIRPRGTSFHPSPSLSLVNSLAYVIYTSGSTGKPKGVLITHRNICPLLHWGFHNFGLGPNVRTLQNLSYFFDWSAWEIFITLASGGGLYVAPTDVILNPDDTMNFIKTYIVTVLHITPTQFQYLLNAAGDLKTLDYLFIGAEKLTIDVVQRGFDLVRKDCRVFNMYGPTEATIISSTLEIRQRDEGSYKGLSSVPIGRPSDNTFLLVLDKSFNISPVRVAGELYIGGDGVAGGYLNRPELTGEKFDHDEKLLRGRMRKAQSVGRKAPCTMRFPPGRRKQRIYKTGDLACWLWDGNVEFLGRIDHQVKIRGFRIELGEIENRLLEHDEIKEAVVVIRTAEPNDKYLCAYIVFNGSQTGTPGSSMKESGLREYLLSGLPGYMVPSYFVPMEKLPLTPNGKIDMKALPVPEIKAGDTYEAPRDRIEKKLVEIWSGVLGIEKEKISINDNFFHLGGHSLKATTLVSLINKELKVNVPLTEIFKTSHIRGLAAFIKNAETQRFFSIGAAEKKEYYILSSAQRRLSVLQQMDENGIAYNMPSVWQLEGDLDREKFEAIFQQLFQRHETLRTSFHLENEEPVQRVHEENIIGDWSLVMGEAEKCDIEDIIKNFIKPFNLSRGPLFRVGLIKLPHTPAAPRSHPSQEGIEHKYILMVDMHHIISDGMSIGILVREFMELYAGKGLPGLRLQYKDYSEWQHQRNLEKPIQQQEAYWLKEFPGDIPALELPIDYPRPPVQDFAGRSIHFEINREETNALKSLANEQAVTLFMLLLSLYTACLSRLCMQEEILVGTPIAGRRHADLEHLLGMFVNTLALRHFPLGSKPFTQFLQEVKESTIKAFENQDYLYEDLVEKVDLERDTGRNPLFDTMFAWQNFDALKIEIPGLKVQPLDYETRISKFDLSLTAVEAEDILLCNFDYRTKLFKEETIDRFIRYFTKTISTVIDNHDIRISRIEIIGEEEKNRILHEINDTAADYPKDKSIHRQLEEHVINTPDNIALYGCMIAGMRGEEGFITYKGLNEKSTRLAFALQKKGVQPDTVVGIMMERSVDMIIGILGILKSGGTYLPIDPDYPQERIDYMLKDSSAKMLIITITLAKEIKKFRSLEVKKNLEIIFIDSIEFSVFSSSHLLNFSTSHSTNLAYVLYTSGSTGKPKGVMVEHRNVIRLVINSNYIHFSQRDRLLLTGTVTFDITTFEIWGPLCNGITLLLASKEVILNPGKLKEVLLNQYISILHLIPQLFNQLAAQDIELFAGLRCFLVGGDLVQPVYINKLRQRYGHLRILHMYGPTENTTFSTFFLPDRDYEAKMPIGTPISNSTVFILNNYGHLQPVGIMGELCVGGQGLARGYLNRPGLTVEKFIEQVVGAINSFKSENNKKLLWGVPDVSRGGFLEKSPVKHLARRRQKIYRTGDAARWLPDGNIEFLGRIDRQVKIRGFRIEPGEIENRLMAVKYIKEAVVIARRDEKGDKYLTAYIVTVKTPYPLELRNFLSKTLPDYMIPSYFILVEKIPLTPNGKIDSKALPVPEIKEGDNYEAPRNRIEKKLVEIWSGVLGIEKEKIGINDNFFHMGGHSLKATTLVSRIHKELKANVPLPEIFKTSHIRGLAAFIKNAETQRFFSIGAAEKKEYYILSSAQRRLSVLQQMDKNGIAYNIPAIWQLEGALDREKFKAVFQQLVQRHETLRTSFHLENEEPVQRVYEENVIGHLSLVIGEAEKSDIEDIIMNFIKPFDLSRAPLLRVELIKLLHTRSALRGHPRPGTYNSQEGKRGKYLLMVDIHHIISDGMSIGIFVKEFMALYAGKKLPGLRLQYKDYSEWRSRQALEKQVKQQEAYWLKEFSGDIPVLDLPIDYPRPPVQDFAGHTIPFEVDKEEYNALKSLANIQDVTLFMLVLSLYTACLSRLGGQEEIVVGTPIAGRRHADLEPLMGMFVNTLALRHFPLGSKPFTQFLTEVKKNTIKAFENQDYLYEDLVEQVDLERDTGRNPLFDTMFAFQNFDALKIEIPGLKVQPFDYETRISKFDLLLTAVETGDNLHFIFEYCTKLFKQETIRGFIRYFSSTISTVLDNHEIKISGIEIIGEEEKNRILYEFNDTAADYPGDKTVHRLFEEQVERTPDNIALSGCMTAGMPGEEGAITYNELNEKSNRLAYVLQAKGVGQDTVVGIMVERSLRMIIGILGILKAGGAYMSIAPGYPENRILSMLNDSVIFLLLTNESCIKPLNYLTLANTRPYHGSSVITPPRPPIKDFNELPIPDRTLVNYSKYHNCIGNAPVKNAITIQSSRGCPFNCMFCHNIWPKQHAVRSAENIFQEMRCSYDAGVTRFVFLDDIFNLDMKNSGRLLRMIIKNNLDVRLFFPNGLRGDKLTGDYIDLLVEAGTVNFSVALESASPRIQKMIRKNLNIEKFQENMDYITKNYPHIILEMEMMFGFPTETEEEALLTFDFLKNLKWVHFPNLNILKIYPNTDISKIAIESGIPEELIERSSNMAFHELPETLPFPKAFARQYQARFLSEYFLSKERLLHVLPFQMKTLCRDELVKKYDSYLPAKINDFPDILKIAGINQEELKEASFLPGNATALTGYREKILKYFPSPQKAGDACRVLLLDLSQLFSKEAEGMLYDVVEAPLGLMYLLTYINKELGSKVIGKIAKSRIDFDSFVELKHLIADFQAQVIGIRTLSYYNELFHKSVSLIKQWYPGIPIITGGPYSTTDYHAILSDINVDVMVLGEGEVTLVELLRAIIKNQGELPGDQVLAQIPGIAFLPRRQKALRGYGSPGREVLLMDMIWDSISTRGRGSKENPRSLSHPKDLAYVLYTSGSTGKPKGVGMPHRPLFNLIFWQLQKEIYSRGTSTLQFTTYTFDVSFQEIFSTLGSGGELVLIPEEMRRDLGWLLDFLEERNIERLFLPFVALQHLARLADDSETLPLHLREIITAGERLKITPSISRFLKRLKPCVLHNQYGPTESHVVTAFTLTGAVRQWPTFPPIGYPIANSRIYLLDRYGKLVPIGAPGEIFIGGCSLARGYLNRVELTAEKFCLRRPGTFLKKGSWTSINFLLNHSPLTTHQLPIYKTGDLARWLPDGNIEFLGRIDHQVKIRGFRVEPGEVENLLLAHDKIKDALVLLKSKISQDVEDDEDKYLTAYIVAGKEFNTAELREYLSQQLPEYMIPDFFIHIDKIPLTSTGKADKKALAELEAVGVGHEYISPGNQIEEKLTKIWSGVLGIEPAAIGIDANFFELGGHSLKASILVSKIHKELKVNVPLPEVFKTSNIRGLAAFIKSAVKDKYKKIKAVETKEYYPVFSAQKRVYLSHRIDKRNVGYNLIHVIPLGKKIKIVKLKSSLKKVVDRHESLRTSFEMVKGQLVQRIHKELSFDFDIEHFRLNIRMDSPGASPPRLEEFIVDFIKPFELSEPPLFRIGLVETAEGEHILIFDIHHIITDGRSMEILTQEFISLYTEKELFPVRLQFKDFSNWYNSPQQNILIKEQEEFWTGQFRDKITLLNLPTDFERPPVLTSEGDIVGFNLDSQKTGELGRIKIETNTTMFMVLIAIYSVFLAKITNQEDILVGIPIAGRRHTDLQQITGMFVNTLVMRNQPTKDKSFREFLSQMKEYALDAFENQEYQFENLVELVAKKRDASRNPIFDTMFSYQDIDKKETGDTEFVSGQYDHKYQTSLFDLSLMIINQKETLKCIFFYNINLFKKRTVLRFVRYFQGTIDSIVNRPGIKLGKIDIFPGEEKQQFLEKINNTEIKYQREKTVPGLFEKQAAKIPGQVALILAENHYTYGHLNESSTRLAHFLASAAGIKSNSLVGLWAEKPGWGFIGFLGILKAGAAYIPLQPDTPAARLEFILQDSRCQWVLTDNYHTHRVMKGAAVEMIDIEKGSTAQPAVNFPSMNNNCGDLAGIYYEPGDSKNPPGILVEHNVLLNSVESIKQTFKVNENWHYLISNEICTMNFLIDLPDFPFGQNINSQKAVILDSSNNLLPTGVSGGVYIDGLWKRYGYLNQPGLTALRFIRSPFAGSKPKKLFLTGKIGKYLDNGDIVLVSREEEGLGKEQHCVEPANEKERKILAIWEKILGEKTPGVTADFFQVGGSSIEALLLVTEINKTFKRKLSITDMYENENIRKQAALVEQTPGPDKREKLTKDKNIFRLKVGSRGSKNIFLIHDATGEVDKYRLFCKELKSRDNYWGLQLKSAAVSGLAPQKLDIASLASGYIASTKQVQARGPYYLGGWSIGGLIAFEMARQLEQAGEHVDRLFMFDTSVPVKNTSAQPFNLSSELELINQYFQVPVTVSDGFKASNPEELWQEFLNFIETDGTYNQGYIVDKLGVYSELISDFHRLPAAELFKYVNRFRSTASAGSNYCPGTKIKAKLQYYQAELSDRDAANWQDFFTNKIDLHQTRGNHFNMFNGPQLKYLIGIFQEHNHIG